MKRPNKHIIAKHLIQLKNDLLTTENKLFIRTQIDSILKMMKKSGFKFINNKFVK